MRKLLIILFIVTPLFAQDIPAPRALEAKDIYSEIGQLHMQIKQLDEYISTLKQQVAALQAENRTLKEKK